jgi:hypothetical protein
VDGGEEQTHAHVSVIGMNATKTSYIENQFGPPSELINVAQFIQSTSAALFLPQYPPEIAEQCRYYDELGFFFFFFAHWLSTSVADIRDSLTSVGNDAKAMSHLIKTHDLAVATLHLVAERSSRSRKRPAARDTSNDPQAILDLQSELDKIPLESWK